MRLYTSYFKFRKDVANNRFADVIRAQQNEIASVAPDIYVQRDVQVPIEGQGGILARASVNEQLRRHHSIPDTPDLYRCPITTEIMNDPVNAEDGYTYERSFITKWLEKNSKSPMTNLQMGKSLVPNNSLRSAIMEFIEAHERKEKNLYSPDQDSSSPAE